MMRRAFTMIELLVATMLLAMLVTILTMMFNQSSIAVGMLKSLSSPLAIIPSECIECDLIALYLSTVVFKYQ